MTGKFLRDRKYLLAASLLFLTYLTVGLSIYPDYGVSTDEITQRKLGILTWQYMGSGDYSSVPPWFDWDHGPAFQIVMMAAEKLVHPEGPRKVFLLRHLLNFLVFFAAVWFFYLLCNYHFGDRRIAILGTLFLILSPRIFANSFYNPKDLPFLSFFVLCMYTLVRFSDTPRFRWAAAHALACAFLIDIRITGVVIVAVTFLALGGEWMSVRREPGARAGVVKAAVFYTIVLIASVIAFWPQLWHSPVIHFLRAFRSMSHYRWPGHMFYLGSRITGREVPWHYIPLWMIMTTPLLYLAAFLAGLIVFVSGFVRCPSAYLIGDRVRRREFLFVLCFFLPLAAVIAMKSVLYNGWRHMYFIYPAFLVISLGGVVWAFRSVKSRSNPASLFGTRLLAAIIAFGLLSVSYTMAENHPYQNVYFNVLVPKGDSLNALFEVDYWDLSYRQAFEYILSHDDEEVIPVLSEYGKRNRFIMKTSERHRLRFVSSPRDAKYRVTHEGEEGDDFPGQEEYYAVNAYGTRLVTVYKVPEKGAPGESR